MAHKVLVMSPLHNMGATTVSALLAQGLTFDNKTTMTLFSQTGSLMPTYLGIEGINDPTRSVMQIVKLIDNGAIEDNDILDYAHQFSKNAYLLNVADPSLEGKDRIQVITHVYAHTPTDIVFLDNSEDITSEESKDMIEVSDMVFIVVDMSIKAANHLKEWLQSPELKDNPNVFIIVNGYNEVISSMRNYAKYLGVPANRVCKIHYNPWITMCCHTRSLATVLPLAKELDYRVCNLSNDIHEIIQCINSSIVMKVKKGF